VQSGIAWRFGIFLRQGGGQPSGVPLQGLGSEQMERLVVPAKRVACERCNMAASENGFRKSTVPMNWSVRE